MDGQKLEELRYPIGKFERPANIPTELLDQWIPELEELPSRLRKLVENLTEAQLETPYRPGGWTVRQLVHHIADSHHNSYIRFKWALTEASPVIKVYDEKGWAELHDSRKAPIQLSFAHLDAVHAKLVYLIRGLSASDLEKDFIHPEGKVSTSLKENIGRYAWHGRHHYNHIARLIEREGW